MEQKTSAEYKTLLQYNKRTAILAAVADECKSEKKMLKQCVKLLRLERKNAKGSKASISAEDLQDIVWRYDELIGIVGKLKKTGNAIVYSRACAELSALRDKIQAEERDINDALSMQSVSESVERLSDKIKSGIKQVGDFVDGAVDKLKKTVKGDD
ncbi:MAG: hypothetical protein K2F90_00530 [Clostridiales bacterium]|nr:hypothetical protein [Clostridiales bacterium]